MYSNIVHKNSQLSNLFLIKNGVVHVFKYGAQKHPAVEFLSKQKRGWACIQILYTKNIQLPNFFLSKNGVGHVFKYCAQNIQLSSFFLSKNRVGHVFKYCAQKHPAIEFLSEQKRGWPCIQILCTTTYSYRISF